METIVLYLCGFWFWLTRKFRIDSYNEAAGLLEEARDYLAQDFSGRASTRDRGAMLPEQTEALRLLEQHSAITTRARSRFDSLSETCSFVFEELTGAPPRPIPVTLPSLDAFSGIAVRNALASLLPDTRSGEVQLARVAHVAPQQPLKLPKAA